MINPENCISCQNPTITFELELYSKMDLSKPKEEQLCSSCIKSLHTQTLNVMEDLRNSVPDHPIWEKFKNN